MSTDTEMKALHIVINAGFTDDVMDIIRESGASGGTIVHARGEGSHHRSFMGITIDYEQEIVICIAKKDTAQKIMDGVRERMGWKSEAHGVAYMLPVDKVVGLRHQV